MRATSIRRLAAGAAALLLVGATTLSAASIALAAQPLAEASSAAIPAAYSPGSYVGFRGTYDYDDSSTLAKLYLTIETTSADGTAVPATYLSVLRNGASLPTDGSAPLNGCTVGLPTTTCVFATVRSDNDEAPGAQTDFVVTLAFKPLASATSATATFTWSTTGDTTSDSGGNSHGDTWDGIARIATPDATGDYAGGFVIPGGSNVVANAQSVSATNIQATKLVGLPAGVAASVKDGSTSGACTPDATTTCTAFIGEWSEVTVGDGQSFTTAFQIVITFYAGTPKSFVHTYGAGQQETIFACTNRKNPAASAPCFVWSAKTNQATIYTLHNGSWRGQ